MAPPNNNTADNTTTKSPFFRPSVSTGNNNQRPHYIVVQQATPRGKHFRRSLQSQQTQQQEQQHGGVDEHKSTLLGATSNLVNAILGCGIVGVPYAIKQSGFVAGIVLIILAAMLTEKSLRLLINTAKHVHVATYETAMESAFGIYGFYFTIINMFIVAYGGMVSYLMIIKDTFSSVIGIDPENVPVRRSILFVISFIIVVPLSCQRDMADLAFTSRLSVIIDTCLVAVIMYSSPKLIETQTFNDNININTSANSNDDDDNNILLSTESTTTPTFVNAFYELVRTDTIHMETIFVGLGVLSFAFVCQHSAYIIAGSLNKPTVQRWSVVTMSALSLCSILAMVCGVSGYIGYRDETAGNILMNLNAQSNVAMIARLSLGICMLFVYPLDSFVVRHVLVVLLFAGRVAHDGDDAAILNRRDRRVLLTLAIYTLSIIPAALFDNLGNVFALTGAVGGSCLSYIGPGVLYLGVHGDEFLDLITNSSFWSKNNYTKSKTNNDDEQHDNNGSSNNAPGELETLRAVESTPLSHKRQLIEQEKQQSCFELLIKNISWYVTGMPVWCAIARMGKGGIQTHIHDMALKSPHPIRIGDVEYKRMMVNLLPLPSRRDDINSDISDEEDPKSLLLPSSKKPLSSLSSIQEDNKNNFGELKRSNSLTRSGGNYPIISWQGTNNRILDGASVSGGNINQQIGKKLLNQQEKQKKNTGKLLASTTTNDNNVIDFEPDPQEATPTWYDFLVAIMYIVFGLIAMIAGIFCIFSS